MNIMTTSLLQGQGENVKCADRLYDYVTVFYTLKFWFSSPEEESASSPHSMATAFFSSFLHMKKTQLERKAKTNQGDLASPSVITCDKWRCLWTTQIHDLPGYGTTFSFSALLCFKWLVLFLLLQTQVVTRRSQTEKCGLGCEVLRFLFNFNLILLAIYLTS